MVAGPESCAQTPLATWQSSENVASIVRQVRCVIPDLLEVWLARALANANSSVASKSLRSASEPGEPQHSDRPLVSSNAPLAGTRALSRLVPPVRPRAPS